MRVMASEGEQARQQRMGDKGHVPTQPEDAEPDLEEARQDDNRERLGDGGRVFGDQKGHCRRDQDIGTAYHCGHASAGGTHQ